eukprot:5510282-Pyramimonas_sp.AAC.1
MQVFGFFGGGPAEVFAIQLRFRASGSQCRRTRVGAPGERHEALQVSPLFRSTVAYLGAGPCSHCLQI